MKFVRCSRPTAVAHLRRQSGVAAIEFAIVFIALFLFLYVIATFGAALYTKQAVARAAEDGARAISLLPTALLENDQRIKDVIYDSLARSLIAPASSGSSFSGRRLWISGKVNVTVTSPGKTGTITVVYPYAQNQLLPPLPLQGFSGWVPTELRSEAIVALRS